MASLLYSYHRIFWVLKIFSHQDISLLSQKIYRMSKKTFDHRNFYTFWEIIQSVSRNNWFMNIRNKISSKISEDFQSVQWQNHSKEKYFSQAILFKEQLTQFCTDLFSLKHAESLCVFLGRRHQHPGLRCLVRSVNSRDVETYAPLRSKQLWIFLINV